jgi:hypothetical protein
VKPPFSAQPRSLFVHPSLPWLLENCAEATNYSENTTDGTAHNFARVTCRCYATLEALFGCSNVENKTEQLDDADDYRPNHSDCDKHSAVVVERQMILDASGRLGMLWQEVWLCRIGAVCRVERRCSFDIGKDKRRTRRDTRSAPSKNNSAVRSRAKRLSCPSVSCCVRISKVIPDLGSATSVSKI